ncbi:TlpA family protein disulfide reductase [Candidatus Harpocratesius sp.]
MSKKFDNTKITLDDIKSDWKVGHDYIPQTEVYRENFEKYEPKSEIVQKIKSWLIENDEILIIVAFGANWCGDCKIQLPRLVKIERSLNDPRMEVRVLTGIKVKAPYQREKGKVIWKCPPSPPETLDERFDMFHIPAIFLFNKKGKCLGKIDEKPEHKSTLEEEILFYLEK